MQVNKVEPGVIPQLCSEIYLVICFSTVLAPNSLVYSIKFKSLAEANTFNLFSFNADKFQFSFFFFLFKIVGTIKM